MAMLLPLLLPQTPPTKPQTFVVSGDRFLLDGKPFVVRSGEMHYPRIPRPLWRDRMRKARAMGLNTVCTYVFWNLHERTPGKFDFGGNLDLATFLRVAREEGLYAIVRPGPYICTELDLGGLPPWLLKDRKMTVRSRDPKFLAATERYFARVGREVAPLLVGKGGPVVMAQVENEYGSYGSDHDYMAWMRDAMRRTGWDVTLFTSDGPSAGQLAGGSLPGLTPTINFGGGAEGSFAELAKFRPGTPRMIGEFWCGWFDQWGRAHNRSNLRGNLKDLEWCLRNDVSFNLYMFHGGTNWEFFAGSNGNASEYTVDITSYDYDAPLDESGRPTAKYAAFRSLLTRFTPGGLPAVPASKPPIALARVRLEESASILEGLPAPIRSERPMTFEDLDQAHGLVLYRTRTTLGGKRTLDLGKLGDYATVFVDGRRVGILDRRRNQRTIELDLPANGARLDLLVESLSRVNFGSLLPTERKGLDGEVRLGDAPLRGWEHFRLPMTSPSAMKWNRTTGSGPRMYRGALNVPTPGDTFLDLKGWNKGWVWVNGRNLGRFWSIGPQRTLFLPGVWTKRGRNEVVIYDEGETVADPTIAGLAAPILDEIQVDYSLLRRKPGQTVRLDGLTPTIVAALADGAEAQTVPLPAGTRGRYLALEALSEQSGGPYASLAELDALAPDGRRLDRSAWRVLYADSEEIAGESAGADNVLDNQPTTFWHTAWRSAQPGPPHVLVVDLGAEVELGALRLLPRGNGPNGRIRDLRVYVGSVLFPGL